MKLTQKTVKLFYCFIAAVVVAPSVFAYSAPVVTREPATMGPEYGQEGQGYSDEAPSWQPEYAGNEVPAQQRVGKSNSANNPQLLVQIEQMAQEIRELRGQLEEQAHMLKVLEEVQRKQYQDLDQRFAAGNPTPSAPKARPAPAPVEPNDPLKISADTPAAEANASFGPEQEQAVYQKAYGFIKNKQYTQAISALQVYVKQYPTGQYAGNAHYWLGELLLLQGNGSQASSEFSAVIKSYPQSPKVADAMLKLGLIYADQGQWDIARDQLTSIKQKFPGSSTAQLAEQRLHQLDVQGH